MNSERSPSHSSIVAGVLSLAESHIDLLPAEVFIPGHLSIFWFTLAKQQRSSLQFLSKKSRPSARDLAVPGRNYFYDACTQEEWRQFADTQARAIERLEKSLQTVAPPLTPPFQSLSETFGVTALRIARYVHSNAFIFSGNPALRGIANFVEEAIGIAEKHSDTSEEEFGFRLAAHLRNEHQWEILPGSARHLFKDLAFKEQFDYVGALLEANKRKTSHLIPARPIAPSQIRASSRMSEVYLEEMQHTCNPRRHPINPRFKSPRI